MQSKRTDTRTEKKRAANHYGRSHLRLEIAEDQSVGIVEVHYHDKKDNDLIQK